MAKTPVTPDLLGEYEQRLLDLSLNVRHLKQQMVAEKVPELSAQVRTFEGALERMERYFPNLKHAFEVEQSVLKIKRKVKARKK